MKYLDQTVRHPDLSIIHFILMVNIDGSRSHHTNWVCICKQSHQIKEVAALLYQSAPTVAIEPVPVIYLKGL
jgi:hypothetical protein